MLFSNGQKSVKRVSKYKRHINHWCAPQTLQHKQKYLHLYRRSLHRFLRNPCSRPVHRTNKSCRTRITNHHSRRKKNYSQLDLEATAIDFGLRLFRHILTGGPQVTVVTDQQPLQSLWRSKSKPSSTIERILLRHQDINHCVVWKKGKENPADFISRHAITLHKLPQRIAEETKDHQKLLFLLHNTPLFSTAITREHLREAQLNDTNLTWLCHFIAINQPPHNDPTLRGYYRLLSEQSIENDVIHKGDQMLLPKSLQQEAISLAHEGSHPGQDAIKLRLRGHFWFPGMDNATKQQVENCHEC